MTDSSPEFRQAPVLVSPAPATEAPFRQQIGQISRHSSVFFGGTIFTAAFGYFFKIYLARVLGAESLGIYALGMTMVGFLSVFNALGLPQSAVRFISAYSALGKWNLVGGFIVRATALLLTSNLLLGTLLLLGGRWVAVHFYHTAELSPYLWLFALILVVGTLNTFLGQVLVGYKKVAQRTLITKFVDAPTVMALTIALVAAGFGLKGYILAQVGSATLVMVLLANAVRKLTPRSALSVSAGRIPFDKEVVSFSGVALGLVFLQFVMGQTDKVLIGYFLSARQVGIYAVTMALVVFVPAVLTSVNQIFAPTISDLHTHGDYRLLGRIFQTLTKWILGLTVPLAMMMIIFARPLMGIFGRDFEAGWLVLVIGTVGQLVNCGVGSVGYILLMTGNEQRLIRIHMASGLIMFVGSALLIPRWGIVGAAVGSALTNVVMNLWTLVKVRQLLGLFPYTRSYLRLLPPIAGTLLVWWLTHSALAVVRPAWAVMAGGLVLAYLVFVGIAMAVGLDADDRLIADAVRVRISGMFHRTEGIV